MFVFEYMYMVILLLKIYLITAAVVADDDIVTKILVAVANVKLGSQSAVF